MISDPATPNYNGSAKKYSSRRSFRVNKKREIAIRYSIARIKGSNVTVTKFNQTKANCFPLMMTDPSRTIT